jgi:tetratricopeptide (TPR) repeat protein
LNALGYTLADKTDRLTEALGLIKQALELRPDDPFILDSMGWVQYRLGNLTQAVEYLEKAMTARPDPEIAAHLGEVLWKMGKHADARATWDRGLDLAPDNDVLRRTIDRFGK